MSFSTLMDSLTARRSERSAETEAAAKERWASLLRRVVAGKVSAEELDAALIDLGRTPEELASVVRAWESRQRRLAQLHAFGDTPGKVRDAHDAMQAAQREAETAQAKACEAAQRYESAIRLRERHKQASYDFERTARGDDALIPDLNGKALAAFAE